jgi:dsRNA-specific ribonuclease
MEEVPTKIHYGVRGVEFENYISNLLKIGGMKEEYIKLLIAPDCMEMYASAVTTKLADSQNNLESLELLGDSTVNKIVVWSMARRFPQLLKPIRDNVGILSRLKANLVSKTMYAKISRLMNMERFITCTEDQWIEEQTKLMEDSLEALIGALEYQMDLKIQIGVGYAICYNIISPLYDQQEISLAHKDLYDSVSRLKEVFDQMKKTLGKTEYVSKQLQDNTFVSEVYTVQDSHRSKIGEGKGKSRKAAELAAAENAIEYLSKRGFARLPRGEDFISQVPREAQIRVSDHEGYFRATIKMDGREVKGVGYTEEEAKNRAAYIFLAEQ